MTQYPDNYGQYSTNGGGQAQYSGLNIEDQPAAPGWQQQGSGYDPAQAYTGDATSRVPYSAPPVQPMYTDPQFQQGYAGAPQAQMYVNPVPGAEQGFGSQAEMDPGTMGQMDVNYGTYGGGTYSDNATFDEEQPLLKELGVDLELIKQKTLSVLNPMQKTDDAILKDTDLAGPLIFCLLFGVILLLSGKVHFGYIYGVGLLGCTSMYMVLNLMSSMGVSVGCIMSVLGYCLLPMVFLSSFSVVVPLQGIIGTILSLGTITWCSFSASKLFVSVLSMDSMQLLIAYPCALLYGIFALLTVF